MWPFKQAYYTLYTYTLSWMMLNFEKAGSIDNSFLETEGSLPVAFCLPDILPSSQKQLIFNMAECVKKRLWHWSMKPWAYLHFVSHASLVTHVLPKICLTSQIHINFFYKKWKQTTLQCFLAIQDDTTTVSILPPILRALSETGPSPPAQLMQHCEMELQDPGQLAVKM